MKLGLQRRHSLALARATRIARSHLMCVVAVSVGLSLHLARPVAAQGKSADSAAVVARVGEQSISVADLEASLAGHAGRMRQRTPSPGEQRAALERRIDVLLLEQVSTERGIQNDPDYVAQRDAILAEAQEKLWRLQRSLLLEQLAAEVEISDAELKARMQQTPRRFQTRRIHLRRLVVADEAAAQAAAARITDGEDFADVAAEVSTDAVLRASRGDLGVQDLSALPPRVSSSARALQTKGQVSEPFRAEGQWNLIQLVASPSEAARAFKDVRDTLEQELRAVKAEQLLLQLLAARREASGVSIDEARLQALAPPLPGEASAEPKPVR